MSANSDSREEAVAKYFRVTPEKPNVGNAKQLMIIGGLLIIAVLLFWMAIFVLVVVFDLFGNAFSTVQRLITYLQLGGVICFA